MEPITIEINMDKKCPRCGKKGTRQNGLCMDCAVSGYLKSLKKLRAGKGSAGLHPTTGQGMPAGGASK